MQMELSEVGTTAKTHGRFAVDEDVECPDVENKRTLFIGESAEDSSLFEFRDYDAEDDDAPSTWTMPKSSFPPHFAAYFTPEKSEVYLRLIDDKPIVWTRKTKWFVATVASIDPESARRAGRTESSRSGPNYLEATLENGRKVWVPQFLSASLRVLPLRSLAV